MEINFTGRCHRTHCSFHGPQSAPFRRPSQIIPTLPVRRCDEGMLKLGLAQQRALADPDNEESDAEVPLLATAAAVDASEYDTTTARPPRFGEEPGPGFPSAAELVRIACESAKVKQGAVDGVARLLKAWREARLLRAASIAWQPRGRYCLLSSAWRMLAGLSGPSG